MTHPIPDAPSDRTAAVIAAAKEAARLVAAVRQAATAAAHPNPGPSRESGQS